MVRSRSSFKVVGEYKFIFFKDDDHGFFFVSVRPPKNHSKHFVTVMRRWDGMGVFWDARPRNHDERRKATASLSHITPA
jgi:hypothetical protein